MKKSGKSPSKKFAAYPRLNPLGVGKNISAADLIDQTFLAYNGGRLARGGAAARRENAARATDSSG